MKTIYVITGQTATGKTSYAINLANQVNGELINCDSRQIYKHLDIITGKELEKTTNQFQRKQTINKYEIGSYIFTESQIPIWLYDIISPDISFSTFDYRTCAIPVIEDIISREKTPIIVGGSYFYLKHLLYGTVDSYVKPNPELRNELNTKSVDELQHILLQADQTLFNSLNHSDKYNPHRLIRKIEITKAEKVTNKKELPLKNLFPEYKIEMIGFKYHLKEKLHEIITQRVIERLEQRAIEEVQNLLKMYTSDAPGLKTIGYSQIIAHLQKQLSYKHMRKEWILKELQYAKRQLTFMKKDTHIHWQEVT
ncbi:MAG TPA: tRNA (adenosine(37)-N6)-dimethylallyltransferase MiaA [Candidatus Woesebacteria bacterium]|nr:tRNA (adenosine(37)-N6)-dimethylallyltransferase MiaA [Candidatus Woesebacteria bacterium]